MSEVIEDLLGNAEKAKELKKENRRLSKLVEQLRKDLKRASEMFDKMIEFTKHEGRDRDAIRELSSLKVEMEKRGRRLADTRAELMKRNNVYNELWVHKVKLTEALKTSETQVQILRERGDAVDKLRSDEKLAYENQKKQAKKEAKNLEKDIWKLGSLNKEYLNKIECLEEERKKNFGNDKQVKEMKKYIERLEKMNAEINLKASKLEEESNRKEGEQRHQLVRKDQELLDQLRKKDQEIKNLKDRMKRHNEDQVELKKELESTKIQLKNTYNALQSCDKRADIVKGMMENLEKELKELKKAQINETTPVATLGKP